MLSILLPFLRASLLKATVIESGAASAPVPWTLEPAHTHVSFSVRHLGLTRTPGIFRRFNAQLAFDDLRIEASGISFEIEAASIDTAFAIRDKHLRGTDWLGVQTHPKILFVSREVRPAGGGRQYVIDGDLTIRGITLPVSFDTTLTDCAVNPWTLGPVIGLEATAHISRSAYGMDAIPHALSDNVRLKIETEITRQA